MLWEFTDWDFEKDPWGKTKMFKTEHLNKLFDELLPTTSKYPPYNIVQFLDGTHRLELAVAGFEQSDISVTLKDNILTIKGAKKDKFPADAYIHKGIAARDFNIEFALNSTMGTKVNYVEMQNGLLTISMNTSKVNEGVQTFEINKPVNNAKKEFLAEESKSNFRL